nr:MFS transporter [Gemmatimonadota bacterium]
MARERIQGSAGRTLIGATLGFFVGFAAVSLFGPTAQLLKDSMGLGPTQVGLLVAVPSATGSLLRIPFGSWVETTGGRLPFVILLALSAVGMAGIFGLLASHPEGLRPEHYVALVGLGMLAGCGIAVFSVGIGQVSYWYPQDSQGAPLAVYAGLGNVAPGLFALLLPLVIGSLGITRAYALWLGLLLAGIGAYAWLAAPAPFFQLWARGRGEPRDRALELARDGGQELFPGGSVLEGLKTTARLPQMWVLVGLYFTSFGGFLALTAWFPTYWVERFGLGLSAAGALTMVYSVLTSVVRVPGGFLSDRLEGEWTAGLSFGVMALGALTLGLGGSVPVAVTGA